MFRALWAYRGFIWSSVMREFHGKYRESLLGAFWSIANPLSMIVIYSVIFGQLMRPTLQGYENSRFAFSVYLCAGIITWTLFAEMLGRLVTVFLENGNMIKKSNFPRICLPAIVTISALINFAIIAVIYVIFLLFIGWRPSTTTLQIIPLLILQILFTLGLGIFLGTLNVFFRDVSQLTGVILQFWFWLTPIVYTFASLREDIKQIIANNPLTPLISGYQQIILNGVSPPLNSLYTLIALTLLFLVLGATFFLSRVGELVDEL